MADRVLPSREEVTADLEGGGGIVRHNDECDVGVIAWAYVEGRLVDRETIDYEAAGEAAWRVVATESGDWDLEWDDLIASDSQPFWVDVGKAALDAALRVRLGPS